MAKVKDESIEVAKELGVDPEEFKRRRAYWLISLKQSNKEKRLELLSFIEDASGLRPTQPNLREISYQHSVHVREDIEYSKQVEKLLKTLPYPLPAANSTQDCYHLTHFTNAVIFCALKQKLDGYSQANRPTRFRDWKTTVLKLYKVEEDVEARAEALQMAYLTMCAWLPKLETKPKPNNLETRMDKLEKRVKKLETLCSP
jgi:hypothetical protein